MSQDIHTGILYGLGIAILLFFGLNLFFDYQEKWREFQDFQRHKKQPPAPEVIDAQFVTKPRHQALVQQNNSVPTSRPKQISGRQYGE